MASQDGRVVQGAALRWQSSSEGVGSNPTSDNQPSFFETLHFAMHFTFLNYLCFFTPTFCRLSF